MFEQFIPFSLSSFRGPSFTGSTATLVSDFALFFEPDPVDTVWSPPETSTFGFDVTDAGIFLNGYIL